ncbi:geranylfarnesyl diphosphate synthase [Halopenitus persicus]|uniref:Farnesyl-diphosphate synthase /geranylgeranyl-diphosphate synthase n=1 Tax=Halopenitus persicus TaxID=1048396 RepID=A0A1H3DMA4_9EURY|nr:polyprenyl synthetase family protein [Halopenitus persicus]SDX67546.1 farnesyl-diphosphate synthase /geranylgeranyl-diphosphate synthase [Halopenitus persicus]
MTNDATEARVLDAVRQRRELVNAAIDEELPLAEPERLYEASRYILEAGGKRLRPTVVLLAGEAIADVAPGSVDYRSFPTVTGSTVDLLRAAVSIEVIQSFTLIHDDIMDEDDLRRGVPAVHEAYDTSTAILAGDTLYSKAFEMMADTGSDPVDGLEAMRLLASTCTKICEGQALDVAFESRGEVLPDEYLEMVELKTAVLYGAAAATPAVLLGADDEVVDALHRYGIDSGSAFQIQDDVLDLTVPSEELGKQRGSDLVEEKETLITLHARQQGVDVDDLVDAETPADVTDAEIETAVSALEKAGSIEYARGKAQELTERSKRHLEVLPDNEARETLAELADYLITRGY